MSEQAKPQPALKKEHSYTYWVGEGNKSRELPEEHRPKKIDAPIETAATNNASGPSKWNALGSWEERTISPKELNEAVDRDLRVWLSLRPQTKLTLKEVSLQGEFKQIFSCNKRKVLYEITGKLKFQGDDLQLKLKELTCSGDREFQTKGKNKQQKAALQAVADQIVEVVVTCFNRYKE